MSTVHGTAGRMPPDVLAHLERHHVMTLSSSSFTGMPHADTVLYTHDARRIYFFAEAGSPLRRNVDDSRWVSFTVDDYTVDWRKVRELRGTGQCEPAAAARAADVWLMYLTKFGPGFTLPAGTLYVITPRQPRFVTHHPALAGAREIRQTFQEP